MAMTVVVTRNAAGRVRGFLTSCMCEIAPGVYTAPRMTEALRDRIWDVMTDWFEGGDSAIMMTWPDPSVPGGQGLRALGVPRTEVVDHHGIFLARRELNESQVRSLTNSDNWD